MRIVFATPRRGVVCVQGVFALFSEFIVSVAYNAQGPRNSPYTGWGGKRKVYNVRFKLNHFPNAVFMMINGKKVLNASISRLCVVRAAVRAAVDQIHHCPCGETCK